MKRQEAALTIRRCGLPGCLSALLLSGLPGGGLAAGAPTPRGGPLPPELGSAGAVPAGPRPGDPWKRYVSEKGRFSVDLPGTPEETSEEVDFGSLGKGREYSLSSFDLAGIYSVIHTVIPSFPLKDRQAALAFIEGTVARISQDLDKDGVGKRKATNMDMGNTPGKELQFSNVIGEHVVRIYVARNIRYVLYCLIRKDAEESSSCRRFLDSFRIAEP